MQSDDLVTAYLAELASSGRSHHTLRGYRGDLANLVLSSAAGEPPVNAAAVNGYLASLGGLSRSTRARRLSALRGFLVWAADRGAVEQSLPPLRAPESTDDVPRPTRKEPIPDPKDIDAVLGVIPRAADRDHLLFGLLARLGLRLSEALALDVADVELRTQSLNVRGWGGRRRSVLVDDPQLLLRLENWLHHKDLTSGPLFPSPRSQGSVRYQSVVERWSRYTQLAGIDLALGDLRKAHIADLQAGGVPEWIIRDRVGQRTGELLPAAHDASRADLEIRQWRESRSSVDERHTAQHSSAAERPAR